MAFGQSNQTPAMVRPFTFLLRSRTTVSTSGNSGIYRHYSHGSSRIGRLLALDANLGLFLWNERNVRRQGKHDLGAAAQNGLSPDLTAVLLNDVFNQVETQARAFSGKLHGAFRAEKLRKKFVNVLRRDANPRVLYRNLDKRFVRKLGYAHGDRKSTRLNSSHS